MAYNKKAHLLTNTEAIRIAFTLDREKRKATNEERIILQQYSGFGGIKSILNPTQTEMDKAYWTKSDMDMFPMVADLHQLIRDNSKNEQEYKRYFGSLRNSVLTAFYTPPEIVQTISDTLKDNGITPVRFLDPSAGNGAFADTFKTTFPNSQSVCFEKDLLTGKILSHLHPDDKVHIQGFEEIENRPGNQFDVISSNIPFGDVSVFDASFVRSNDMAKRQSTRAIHNYFFLKSIDHLREGGVVAFITSQGVMNNPQNEPVRDWLMKNTNLVSAVRLPSNLFTDHAGTEVGSDLIILQKNSKKTSQTTEEQAFIQSRKLSNGENVNNLFKNFDRVVHTKFSVDTDPYGKPATVFVHEGGSSGMASDLKKMLSEDFNKRLNKELYQNNTQSLTSLNSLKPLVTPKVEQPQPKPTATQEPIISLYDLWGFSENERKQQSTKKRGKQTKQATNPRQLDLFSQSAPNPTQAVVNSQPVPPKEKPTELPVEPRPYSGALEDYHKQGSLAIDNGQVGFLKARYRDDAEFMPLELNPLQKQKAEQYIKFRDTYHLLYNYEATERVENKGLRESLNTLYDDFVRRYGNLNDRKNLDLIKMDAGGQEILSLERAVDGKLEKADIFTQPVAFNPNEITEAADSMEALSASLNKFGEVNTEYMLSLMPEKNREEMLEDLHGRIYYNPLIRDYEVSDRFIAGNVVEKAESLERYLKDNPQSEYRFETSASLKALQDATPRPISFEELDFNFGERWIPQNIYGKYASYLFDVDTNVQYSNTRDEYSVKASYGNANINDKYCVRGEFRRYDGVALMKHALHNTTPNISKSIEVTDSNGDRKTVKVRDGEKIQLANSKIDEIRNGFTDWLNGQSPEFKQRLADLYNQKFNCFVRPQYDGSHQSFPNLDFLTSSVFEERVAGVLQPAYNQW